MNLRHLNTLAILVVCIMLILPGAELLAQDQPGATPPASEAPVQILLRPDGGLDAERLTAEAQPGETKTLAVYIGNLGAEPLRVVTYTADISTRVNGGLAIEQRGEEQSEPTTWITYPTEELTIDPGKEFRREFALNVPADATPGEYVVPIAVETLDAFAVPDSEQLLQKIRKIITIYITVPGDMQPAFTLGEPLAQYLDQRLVVDVPATNTGNTTLRLTGNFTLSDANGTVIVDTPMAMGAFYMGDETFIRLMLGSAGLPAGDYLVTLSLTDTISSVSQSLEEQPVTIPEPPSGELIPLAFNNILILPNADPIQFAGVALEIVNNADVIRNGRLVLVVEKDGQPLEEFPVAENLTLNQGVTTVAQRYLPLAGWESGTYTFSLRLESVKDDGSVNQVLLTQDDVATITVP